MHRARGDAHDGHFHGASDDSSEGEHDEIVDGDGDDEGESEIEDSVR